MIIVIVSVVSGSVLSKEVIAMRFILRGKSFNLEKETIYKATKGKEPGSIRKYAINLNGTEYPIKQVMGLATNLSPADFTAHDAYRILRKLGFGIIVYD